MRIDEKVLINRGKDQWMNKTNRQNYFTDKTSNSELNNNT